MTATPRSDLGVDVTTGEYGDESTDVIVRRYIECGELRLEVAGDARELAAALVAAADKLDARSQPARRGVPLSARGYGGALRGLQSITTEGTSHGLVFRKRIRIGANETVNLSKGAASVAKRVGQVTVNSRGRGSIRILPGLSVRFGRRW